MTNHKIAEGAVPFFSVVVPVYNKEPHIARAINSILNQTFQDFELIIVCDPSTDNSNTEVAKFTDSRIRIFHRDEPGPGGYAARNLGIKEAKAEWVAFLDADDEWIDFHLNKINKIILKYPKALVASSSWKVFEHGNLKKNNFSLKSIAEEKFMNFEEYLFYECTIGRPIWTSVACINKKVFDRAGAFPEGKISMGGDVETWLRCVEYANGLAWSSHCGAIYHKDSVNMTTKSSYIEVDLHCQSTNKILNKPFNESIKKLIKRRHNNIVTVAWNNNFRHKEKKNFRLIGKLYFSAQPIKVAFYYFFSSIPRVILIPIHSTIYQLLTLKRKYIVR